MIQPNYFTDSKKIAPIVGLSIYEKMTQKSALNLWAGMGDQVFIERQTVTWYTLRSAVDFYVKKFVVSPGLQSIYVDGEPEWQHRVFVRGSYELW